MTSDIATPTPTAGEPDLARPWAPHRRRAYVALTAVTGFAFTIAVVGVGTGLLPPTFTVDVVANLAFGLPVIVLPLVYFWTGRGEQRSRLGAMDCLTHGDFAAVRQQVEILGEAFTPDEFLAQLEAEHRAKPEVRERRGMGFRA